MKKVIVFGVFDGIHEGHKFFFSEAKKLGDHLTAVVAADEIAEILKGRRPTRNVAERIFHVEKQDGVNGAVVGDKEVGSWEIIRRLRPNIVAVGHDQNELREDLEGALSTFNWPIEIAVISAHEPYKYHNSILNNSH